MAVGGLKAAEKLNPLQEQQSCTPDDKKIKKGSLTTLKGTKKKVKSARQYWTTGKVLTAGAGVFLAGCLLGGGVSAAAVFSALTAGASAAAATKTLMNREVTSLKSTPTNCTVCPAPSIVPELEFKVNYLDHYETLVHLYDTKDLVKPIVSCYTPMSGQPAILSAEPENCYGTIYNAPQRIKCYYTTREGNTERFFNRNQYPGKTLLIKEYENGKGDCSLIPRNPPPVIWM